jgi:XTP/dITP diphosphohydrolase
MRRLVIATTNRGKLREIGRILEGLPLELVRLDALPPIAEPEETGSTFAENARLKALYYSRATGLPSVADDSGLEIDALDGAPGIHSARWQGNDYRVKFARIYELLRERGASGSGARFVCALALAVDGRIEFEAEGIVQGEISPEPRGSHGFGYDPILFYPPLGRTLGETPDEVKEGLSHRGAAFRALRDYLMACMSQHQSGPPVGRPA